MNIGIFVSSLKHVSISFDVIVQISTWVYEELSLVNYTDKKLEDSLMNDFEISEAIIHMNQDKSFLDCLLYHTYNYTVFFNRYVDEYRRLKLLLEAGADVHVRNDLTLESASFYGNVDEIRLLLDYEADVHANGCKALQEAVENGCIEAARILLEAGADPNTCLEYTEPDGFNSFNESMAQLLLEYINKPKLN